MKTHETAGRPIVPTRDAVELADNLQDLLTKISSHAALSDGRYTDVLSKMQEKLDRLDAAAKAAARNPPAPLAPTRTANPDGESARPHRSATRHSDDRQDDARQSDIRPSAETAQEQETLARLRTMAQPTTASADRAWLDARLIDLSRSLTRSFSDTAATVLTPRLQQLEARIDGALEQAAAHLAGNARALSGLNTQVGDICKTLDALNAMLLRLDSLEAQLHDLADTQTVQHATLSDAIVKSRRRDSDSNVLTALPALTQMNALLENLTRDRLRGESQLIAMLETLQQAMLRVLDRLDEANPTQLISSPPTRQSRPLSRVIPEDSDDDTIADLMQASELVGRETALSSEQTAALQQLRRGFAHTALAEPDDAEDEISDSVPAAARNSTWLPSARALAAAAVALLIPLNAAVLTYVYASTRPDAVPLSAALVTGATSTTTEALVTPTGKIMAPPLPPAIEVEAIAPTPAAEVKSPTARDPQRHVMAQPIAFEGSELNPTTTQSDLELPPATVGPLSLRRAAASGDASAQFEVARRLAEGKGVNQDFKLALNWYLRAASQGFAQAQYRLGTFYERGLGVDKDPARARIWYKQAAEQGNVKAMHNLAVLSSAQAAGTPDYGQALRWFSEAAAHNLPDSQFNLALMHQKGLGTAKDEKLAYKWFTIAARNGDSEALKNRDALKARLNVSDLTDAESEASTFRSKPSALLPNDPNIAGEDWKKRQAAANG